MIIIMMKNFMALYFFKKIIKKKLNIKSNKIIILNLYFYKKRIQNKDHNLKKFIAKIIIIKFFKKLKMSNKLNLNPLINFH